LSEKNNENTGKMSSSQTSPSIPTSIPDDLQQKYNQFMKLRNSRGGIPSLKECQKFKREMRKQNGVLKCDLDWSKQVSPTGVLNMKIAARL
jgi:hypothetical protein